MQQLPSQAGIKLSNWNWKAVRRYVEDRFGLALSRSPPVADLNSLHRLGFVLKRPKKRLLDEAHFQADADLRGKWVLKGAPALVRSTRPRRGEKVSYYSAVCLETREVEVMELEGNSNSATSAVFLRQLRAQHTEPLTVI